MLRTLSRTFSSKLQLKKDSSDEPQDDHSLQSASATQGLRVPQESNLPRSRTVEGLVHLAGTPNEAPFVPSLALPVNGEKLKRKSLSLQKNTGRKGSRGEDDAEPSHEALVSSRRLVRTQTSVSGAPDSFNFSPSSTDSGKSKSKPKTPRRFSLPKKSKQIVSNGFHSQLRALSDGTDDGAAPISISLTMLITLFLEFPGKTVERDFFFFALPYLSSPSEVLKTLENLFRLSSFLNSESDHHSKSLSSVIILLEAWLDRFGVRDFGPDDPDTAQLCRFIKHLEAQDPRFDFSLLNQLCAQLSSSSPPPALTTTPSSSFSASSSSSSSSFVHSSSSSLLTPTPTHSSPIIERSSLSPDRAAPGTPPPPSAITIDSGPASPRSARPGRSLSPPLGSVTFDNINEGGHDSISDSSEPAVLSKSTPSISTERLSIIPPPLFISDPLAPFEPSEPQPQQRVLFKRDSSFALVKRARAGSDQSPVEHSPLLLSPRKNKKQSEVVSVEAFGIETSASQAAVCLTACCLEMLAQVDEVEFLDYAFGQTNSAKATTTRMIDYFNTISHWVATRILRSATPELRLDTLRKFIAVCSQLLKLGNYHVLTAVFAGLSLSPISRLKATWAALPEKNKTQFARIETLLSSEKNYSKYREGLARLNSVRSPCIPYLGVYLRDFTFIHEGNATLIKGNINYTKLEMIASSLHEFRTFRSAGFRLAKHSSSHLDYFRSLPGTCFDYDQLYDLSQQAEPRAQTAATSVEVEKNEALRESNSFGGLSSTGTLLTLDPALLTRYHLEQAYITLQKEYLELAHRVRQYEGESPRI